MARVSADERRRQLVAAAFRVIGRDGFAGVTTRRVCAEAGAPLAAFHYCFASEAGAPGRADDPDDGRAAVGAARDGAARHGRGHPAGGAAGLLDDRRGRPQPGVGAHGAHPARAAATRRSTAWPSASTRPTTPPRARRCSASPRGSGSPGRCRSRTWPGCSSSSPTASRSRGSSTATPPPPARARRLRRPAGRPGPLARASLRASERGAAAGATLRTRRATIPSPRGGRRGLPPSRSAVRGAPAGARGLHDPRRPACRPARRPRHHRLGRHRAHPRRRVAHLPR